MISNNIIFIVIIVLIALVILSVVVNESFCNCLGTGMKYESSGPASYASYGGGGYKTKYGWPVGMPYDSYARQMMTERDGNFIPNMEAVNKMTCTPGMFQPTYKLDNKSTCEDEHSNYHAAFRKSAHNHGEQNMDSMMVQSPETSYKMVYNDTRGPGRYGYGSKSGGMTSYSSGEGASGCGFPLLEAGPPSRFGPAGSFQQPSGGCSDNSGYNLSIGVM